MLLAVCIALFKWEVSETVQLALFFLLIEYNYNFICMDVIKMVYVCYKLTQIMHQRMLNNRYVKLLIHADFHFINKKNRFLSKLNYI